MHRPPVTRRSLAVLVACLSAGASGAPTAPAAKVGTVMLYVGTYTSGESKGIYRLHLDLATGALSPAGEPTETVSPSFLAFHPSRRFLYAVNETGDSPTDKSGAVSAFAIDPATGGLTFLNQQPSGGAAPCHVTIDREGRHAFVANYWGGTVAVLPIQEDGRLGPPSRVIRHQDRVAKAGRVEPHPHSTTSTPPIASPSWPIWASTRWSPTGSTPAAGSHPTRRGPRAWPRARARGIWPSIPAGGART